MTETTGFLYPFIEADERDAGALLRDLSESAQAKVAASDALRRETLAHSVIPIEQAASDMADRFLQGGRLFAFGNGGSSTDAAALAALFIRPPSGRPLPARNLAEDSAVLTALGNDVGFDLVFSRQLMAQCDRQDIAVGLSTSGNSRNLLQAFTAASGRGLLTIGVAGYSGGEMARSPDVRHCLVVEADSVHRIQETQAALGFALWQAVQACLSTAEDRQ